MSVSTGGDANVMVVRGLANSDPFITSLGSDWAMSNETQFYRGSDSSFDPDALPTSLNLDDFDRGILNLFGINHTVDSSFSIKGNITSLTAVSVPEPGTLSLFSLGLFALAFMRRKQATKYNSHKSPS